MPKSYRRSAQFEYLFGIKLIEFTVLRFAVLGLLGQPVLEGPLSTAGYVSGLPTGVYIFAPGGEWVRFVK